MKGLFKLAQWVLVGLTSLLVLISLGSWMQFFWFALALVVLLPVTERLFVQRLAFMKKTTSKAVAWLLLMIVGLYSISAESGEIRRLEARKDIPALVTILQKEETFSEQAATALGNIGDKQAVDPLLKALQSSEDDDIRRESAAALGKIGDVRAAEPLIGSLDDVDSGVQGSVKIALKQLAAKDAKVVSLLMPDFTSGDSNAKSALAVIGEPAIKPLTPLLKDTKLRDSTAEVLGDMGTAKAVEPLKPYLLDWNFGPNAGAALEKLDWQPESDTDKVHFWVALRRGDDLRNNWETTQEVLLNDVKSGKPDVIEYGLYSLIGIGNPDAIASLTDLLKKQGNKTLALAYLNCGEDTLEKAAEDWANANGYSVVASKEAVQTVEWGGW